MNDTQIMMLELGSKGYTCAQILIVGALRLMGEEDAPLVRAMSALAQGIGNSGQLCGALAGGLCMLSLYTAKGHDMEQALPQEALLHEALITWFSTEFCSNGCMHCDALLGIDESMPSVQPFGQPFVQAFGQAFGQARVMDTRHCGVLVGAIWDKCLALLQEYSIDPTLPRA